MRPTNPFARIVPLCALLTVPLAAGVRAQEPMPEQPSDPQPTGRPARLQGQGGFPRQQRASAGPRPYKEVITADAKSDPGLFTVHRIEDRIYFEIPASVLSKEMLWTSEIESLPAGMGYGGTALGNRVVRWTRRNNKVYLRNVDYSVRAEDKGAIQRAIEAATLEPIIMAFDVEAEGKDRSAVIEVTRLFTSDVPEFSARQALGGSGIDSTRTFVEKVKSFPTNIETKAFLTYLSAPAASFGGGGGPFPNPSPTPSPNPSPTPSPDPSPTPTPTPGPRGRGRRPGGRSGSISAVIHYSMVLLPEKPMMGRLFDSRVGFFTSGFEDYGREEHRVVERRYITRYRLEKKDPNAPLSEPVRPIVYYVSREVPEKWRPAMHKAVEAWNQAYEKAGFKNAIVCKDAPTIEEDPNWDPEDARYSVIRWAPTPTENAQGPHVHDPRSGEILSAHIIVWHNVLKLAETWYFTQVADLDPRAKRLPLPDDLMSDLMQYVVCHEVGHTIGLEHNFKASSSYTVAQLRDARFTAQYGDEASIMDYGRFNYVAQPGDNAHLIPMIGPYDRFAIEWGYTPLPNAKTPDDEKSRLDQMASLQISNPQLRFGNSRSEDPSQQMEDLGSDPIEATYYGLKNIGRIAQMLVPATTKFGEDYDLLYEMYTALFGQRQRELGHVATLIGGVVETDYHAGRGGEVYRPVPREQQARAVQFLLENAFRTPHDLLIPSILYRIEATGVVDRILANQRTMLASLYSDVRVKRMLDAQALSQGQTYTISQMVTDLQNGIWSELNAPQPTVDLYRRNLQRYYLSLMKAELVGDTATQTELRPLARGALRDLARAIDGAVVRVKDRDTALHLRDCRTTIDRILNPKS
jgi:hypothetical protein